MGQTDKGEGRQHIAKDCVFVLLCSHNQASIISWCNCKGLNGDVQRQRGGGAALSCPSE